MKRLIRTLFTIVVIGITTILLAPAIIGRWDAAQLRQSSSKASQIQTHWWTTTATMTLSIKQPLPISRLIGTPTSPLATQLTIHHGPFISFDLNQKHAWRFAKNLIELRSPNHWQSPIILIQHWNGTIEGLVNIQQLHWQTTHGSTSIARINGHFTWAPHQSLLAQLTLNQTVHHFNHQLMLVIDHDYCQTTQHLLYHHWHGITQHQIASLAFIQHHEPLLRADGLRTINETIQQQTEIHHRFLLQLSNSMLAGQHIGATSVSASMTTADFAILNETNRCLLKALQSLKSLRSLDSTWRALLKHCLNHHTRIHVKTHITVSPQDTLDGELHANQGQGTLTLHLPRDWVLTQLTDYVEAQLTPTTLSGAEHHAKAKLQALLLNHAWHQAPHHYLTYQASF